MMQLIVEHEAMWRTEQSSKLRIPNNVGYTFLVGNKGVI